MRRGGQRPVSVRTRIIRRGGARVWVAAHVRDDARVTGGAVLVAPTDRTTASDNDRAALARADRLFEAGAQPWCPQEF